MLGSGCCRYWLALGTAREAPARGPNSEGVLQVPLPFSSYLPLTAAHFRSSPPSTSSRSPNVTSSSPLKCSLLLLLLATDPAFRRSPTPAHPPRDSAKLPTPTHARERTRTHANTRTRTSHAGTPLWAHSPARHLGPTAARPAMKIGVLSRPPAGRKRLSFRCIEKAAKAAAGPACCSYGELESGGDVSALLLNPKHVQALSPK